MPDSLSNHDTVGVFRSERIGAIRAAAEAILPDVIALTERLIKVPAPTGSEAERAVVVAEAMSLEGMTPSIDSIGNVTATINGQRPRENTPVILAAHTDTIFPHGTPLEVTRTTSRISGPGVGDNCLGVAALVYLSRLFARAGIQPAGDILLAADVGEEGLGNLRGMRAVLEAWPNAKAVVAIEGHNLGRLTHVAVGSRRLLVTATGPGGHSWGDAGRPSAVHALAQIVSELSALPLPRSPKVSLNVGTFQGGVSVNTIAPTATCLVDLRSVDDTALRRLTERVERIIGSANRSGVRVVIDVMGDRPAGVVSLDSSIVQMATSILGALQVDVAFDASSTDANIPISKGIPAVCIGLSRGGNVHRVDEYIEVELITTGLAQLALLSLALADDSRTA